MPTLRSQSRHLLLQLHPITRSCAHPHQVPRGVDGRRHLAVLPGRTAQPEPQLPGETYLDLEWYPAREQGKRTQSGISIVHA